MNILKSLKVLKSLKILIICTPENLKKANNDTNIRDDTLLLNADKLKKAKNKRHKMTDKQNRFLTLRAEGLSYDAIAKELKTSKPTLIQWSKLFENEIKDLQFESFLKIKEAYSWSVKAKYEMTLKQLNKIDEAILNADLTSSNIKDLFTIKNSLLFQLEAIEKKISVDAKIKQSDDFGNVERLRLKLSEAE